MLIMKFGGTSVGTGERIMHVAQIVQAQRERHPVVVASAMSGVTDLLLALAEAAAKSEHAACERILGDLRARHLEAAQHINPDAGWEELTSRLESLDAAVEDALARRDGSAATRDAHAGFGELLAVLLVAAALRTLGELALAWQEPIIVTDDRFGDATPQMEATRATARHALAQAGGWLESGRPLDVPMAILVTAGFIGQTAGGRPTTLGRGGSDYSATLVAAALDAEACWIYTDVDGVFTADPRVVPDAEVLPRISAAAAGRLSYCGAKVLHPRSIAPVARRGIELRVRNTFRPEQPGTLIEARLEGPRGRPQAVAGRRGLCAVGAVGGGAAEVPGLFGRLCAAVLAAQGEIVQAAHPVVGHDPRVIVDGARIEAIKECLSREFAAERAQGQIEEIVVQEHLALCTLLGAQLGHAQFVQAQRALAAERITPISQSAGPDALSFIIAQADLNRAIVRLHDELIKPALRSGIERPDRPYLDGALPAGRARSRRRHLTAS